MLTHHVLIKGIKNSIMFPVSSYELAFIILMMKDRHSDYYFVLGPHSLRVRDELEEQTWTDEDLW